MAKIYHVETLVEEALKKNPATRGDNFILYLEVLKKFISTDLSLEEVFRNHVALRIPSLETITRCRRKLQEQNPDLKTERATKIRKDEEKDFKKYSKEGK